MFCKALITIRLLVYLSCFQTVEGAVPSFTVPISTTTHGSVDENSQKDVSILTVEGTDTDGDTLMFSLVSQNPTSPPFALDSISGLLKTPTRLDAEFSETYTFTFGVSDGTTTVNSVPFILDIADVNEFSPVFQGTPYNAIILDSARNAQVWPAPEVTFAYNADHSELGYHVFKANATDQDATSTVTYNLMYNEDKPFSMDLNTGQINISNSSQLNVASKPTYILLIQASDGLNNARQNVSITVKVDYCYPADPCQNGTCVTLDTEYFCNCTTGFLGQNCSQVDQCDNDNPCVNGGTCVTSGTSYTCTCASGYSGTNCTTVNASGTDETTTTNPNIGVIVGATVGGLVMLGLSLAFVKAIRYSKTKRSTNYNAYASSTADSITYQRLMNDQDSSNESLNNTGI